MLPVGFEPTISAREKLQTNVFHYTAYKSNTYITYAAGKEIYYFYLIRRLITSFKKFPHWALWPSHC